ncbi:MAG TPA: pitrilysin family protein [Candidatus Acidoferrales bacterium]|jgi:zinc protease|nr:pitrilysin family protein [Candidatus Acidoferrales bacterium]
MQAAAAGILAAALAASGWTQGEAAHDKSLPTSKVERLNRAPVSKDILNVKLPRPIEIALPGGIDLMMLEDHRFPLVTVQFDINGAGPMYEPAGQPGLAGATAGLLMEGTKTRTSKQIAEQIDSLGASLSASAGFGSGSTVVAASGLSDTFDAWFALATDVLLHPSFPADELAQYQARAKSVLSEQRSQPRFLANETMSRALFGMYPAAVVSATPESLDSLTAAMLTDWHDKHYAPQNTILAISGDVHAETLIPKLRQSLAEWQKSKAGVKFPSGPPPASKEKIFLVDRPGSVQTTLLMGNLAVDRASPDYPALVVLNEVLGAGSASRLFLNLREEKGYTYGVYSNLIARKYAGPWTAGGDLRTEVTDGAMTEFLRELHRIRDEKVPDNELDEARRSVVARFALSLESPQQLIAYAMTRKAYNFPIDYWDKYPAQIMAIQAEDVARVAKKYIDPATMQVVAVGDASKIKSVLEKYGSVEMVDASTKTPRVAGKAAGAGL